MIVYTIIICLSATFVIKRLSTTFLTAFISFLFIYDKDATHSIKLLPYKPSDNAVSAFCKPAKYPASSPSYRGIYLILLPAIK